LHTRFRLVPKSMTLDDLERPFRTPFQNTCIFGAHHENLNKDILSYYQRQRCSAMTEVSCNIKFMRIYSQGFLGDESSNDSGVIENVYVVLFSPLSHFHGPQ